jgi:hypothetical protein
MRLQSAAFHATLVFLVHYPAYAISKLRNVEKPYLPPNEDHVVDGAPNNNNTSTSHVSDGNTNSTIVAPSDGPPSNQLTDSPTVTPSVPIDGYITLELVDTPSTMKPDLQELFVNISQAFLTFNIFISSPVLTFPGDSNRTFLSPLVDEEGLTVQMIHQSTSVLSDVDGGTTRRYLEHYNKVYVGSVTKRDLENSKLQPLYVTLKVSAVGRKLDDEILMDIDIDVTSDISNTSPPIELVSLDDFDFDTILQQIFIENQDEFIEALQITEQSFFSGIDQVNVLLESTVGDLRDMTQPPSIDTDKDVIADQGDDRDSPGFIPEVTVESTRGSVYNSFFTTPIIIGISVGGAVVLCLIFGCLGYCMHYRRRQQSTDGSAKTAVVASEVSQFDEKAPPTPKSKPWNRKRNKGNNLDGPVDSMAEQHLMRTDTASNRPDEEVSEVASDVDTRSLAMYSYNPRGDSGSVYTANNSIMINGGGGAINSSHSMYGNDNSSYAYSLEPGIETSIMDGVFLNNTLLDESNMYEDRVPILEIPHISVDADASRKGKIGVINNREQDLGDTHIETAASDLKLTPSELGMLPSNLRSGDDTGEQEESDADSKGFPTFKNSITKTILAPSGKLGIVIDTTVEGPVVHNVNRGSRLEGQIFSGDIIVAIDNVDTRAMSATAITALMVKTASQQRKLTIRRADPIK